jgi:simple sugar transport system permease protein
MEPATAREPAGRRPAIPKVLIRLVRVPEITPVAGAIVVFAFFALVAGDTGFLTFQGTMNYLEVAAQLGIIAIFVTLLMIAGEFDLSVGSMLGAAGVMIAYPVVELGWPLWAALLFGLAASGAIGAFNGFLTVRTGLPSFIITLAALFILRGVTIAFTHSVTDGSTSIGGVDEATEGDPLRPLFAGTIFDIPIVVFWWLALTAIATVLLTRTPLGNWIFGAGGDPAAARRLGVPVARVKLILFVLAAMSSALVAAMGVLGSGAADVLQGQNKEFQAITAAVIGGTLLTGGYGTVVGTAFGALIFGMVSQGIFFTQVDADWFLTFIGVMLLLAVFINHYVQRYAQEIQ